MIYTVAVISKDEVPGRYQVIDPGIFVNASNPTDACKQVESMSTNYYLPEEKLLLARTHSNIIDWLTAMAGSNVRLIKGIFTHEGILHWNNSGFFEVRFHEFLPGEISSYGYSIDDVAYIVLIQET